MHRFIAIAFLAHLGVSGVGQARAQVPEVPLNDSSTRSLETPRGVIEWRLHTPAGSTPEALVVVLHGCLQDAEDIAAGTGMDDAADRHGFAVLYPQQDAERNAQQCWNWFLPEAAGGAGTETTMLASLVEHVAAELELGPAPVHLVGMSAGAAMAANLAVARPDLFEGVVMHSGVPWGAAKTMAEGLAAMQFGGPEQVDLDDPELETFLASASPRRFLMLHGEGDPVVRPVNSERAAARWVRMLGERATRSGFGPLAGPAERELTVGGATLTAEEWAGDVGDGGAAARVTLVIVPGLGHAWSGGNVAGTFTDPSTVPATELIVGWLGLNR